MTTLARVLCAFCLAALPACDRTPAGAALERDQQAAVIAEVERAWAEYGRRINAGDFEGAQRFYADDPRFAWVEDGRIRYTSRQQVMEGFGQLRQAGPVRVELGPPAITVLAPDVALLFATHKTTIGDSGKGFSFAGAMTITLVRTNQGWQFLSGHTSSSRPGPG
jgi:ketosteroid isomerase-like protein